MKNLRENILDGISKNASLQTLVGLVLLYKDNGMSQQETYDVLQVIWIELGCHQAQGYDVNTCDLLSDLMDRVGGFCRSEDSIWDMSLSGKKMK